MSNSFLCFILDLKTETEPDYTREIDEQVHIKPLKEDSQSDIRVNDKVLVDQPKLGNNVIKQKKEKRG